MSLPYGRTIPKWNKPEILICLMGGLFLNGINRKYCCGFWCGCGALTIGAATDAASATAATTIIVTDVEIIKVTPKQQEHKTEAPLMGMSASS